MDTEEEPMSGETITCKRSFLYEQVWAQPITTGAKSYGISTVGLAKICARLRVPPPGRGYWQRLKHGKVVRRPPLPSLRDGESEEHVIQRSEKVNLEPGTGSEFAVLAAREKDPVNRIVAPESLARISHRRD